MEDGQGLVFVGFPVSVFSFIRFFVLLDSHTMDKQIFLLLSLLLPAVYVLNIFVLSVLIQNRRTRRACSRLHPSAHRVCL